MHSSNEAKIEALHKGAVETSALNALALDGRVPTALLAHTMYITL